MNDAHLMRYALWLEEMTSVNPALAADSTLIQILWATYLDLMCPVTLTGDDSSKQTQPTRKG
jgi:hypothetical protein